MKGGDIDSGVSSLDLQATGFSFLDMTGSGAGQYREILNL